jgi:Putative Flp pilus-assembly TadE/G-like
MGITLILVMGMLAFIINVGLFVKAKINLQNAVDAAAFSGAATQARQLTNIAYVNWELRNTFKEWMFKYYVLGQLGLAPEGPQGYNLSDSQIAGSGSVSFLLRTPSATVVGTDVNNPNYDKYNVPSICIHNNSSTNICPLYALPGIPRFPAIGVAGISEIHEAFVNKLVDAKGENCSQRTQINFLAANAWAYSSGIKNMPGAPLIATNRPGAWTQALDIAMRMRNLEMIVNRPPVEEPIGLNEMKALQDDSVAARIGLNERPIKAFTSAIRNLGGGKYKEAMISGKNDGGIDELSYSFKLTEIPPQPFQASPGSLSAFLIPDTAANALKKHYLDLQIMTVNYAPLFTMFATTRNQFEPGVDSEASCYVSKTALPVPGYILGFVKNPHVMTYYAVKGEAEFTGLFFPKNSDDQPNSFTLTAYASAKPYGGRIGPKLFAFTNSDQAITARADKDRKSGGYFSGMDISDDAGNVKAGAPIPPILDFWANISFTYGQAIGGAPDTSSGSTSKYGIPNMIYDIEKEDDMIVQSGGTEPLQIVRKALGPGLSASTENKGLYDKPQFRALKLALGGANPGTAMNSDDVMRAIIKARRVTRYDIANYLVPDHREVSGGSNAAPFIHRLGKPPGITDEFGYEYALFAPLAGPGLLYESSSAASALALGFRSANSGTINNYLNALKQVAQNIFNLPSQGGSTVNLQAAKSIHVNSGPDFGTAEMPPMVGADPTSPTCLKDMASKFNHFFNGSVVACGIVPLELMIAEYIDKQMQDDGGLYYRTTYYNNLSGDSVMTAYHPGPAQGASEDPTAMASHPLNLNVAGTSSYSTRRNYYSTKFFQLAKAMSGASSANSSADDYRTEPLLRESDTESPVDLGTSTPLANPINAATSGYNSPFFLDF